MLRDGTIVFIEETNSPRVLLLEAKDTGQSTDRVVTAPRRIVAARIWL